MVLQQHTQTKNPILTNHLSPADLVTEIRVVVKYNISENITLKRVLIDTGCS